MCQHGTSKKKKVVNIPARVDTCVDVDFLPASSATHEWLATSRLMRCCRGAIRG